MPKASDKTKTYKANQALKQRVGSGPLNPILVERAQKALEDNDVDFTPLGLQFLGELEKNLDQVGPKPDPDKLAAQKQLLTEPVMELKANATLFHYSLVGNLANIMLNFLESINELDKDALSIVRGHHDSLKAIITNKMKGDGGGNGKIMMSELSDACARYYNKKKKQGS